MPDVIDVRNVLYVIYDMYGALTYTICMYVNMGVKRSVMTSGMQPTILDILQKKSLWPKTEMSYFLIFPLYFSKFPLYILYEMCTVEIH